MNPSPQAVSSIRAEVADWTQSDAAIVAALNAPAVANPAPQGQVATPFAVSDVFGKLSAASQANLPGVGFLPEIRDDINNQDRSAVGLWAQVLAAGAIITPAEATAITDLLAVTEPDPAWPAQISWAQSNLGRPVDLFDVQAARVA